MTSQDQKNKNYEWAYVKCNNIQTAVLTKEIRNFDPTNFDRNKKYNMKIDGKMTTGLVAFVTKTKKELDNKTKEKRIHIPPSNLVDSASEIDDTPLRRQQSKGGTNQSKSVKPVNQDIIKIKKEKMENESRKRQNKINDIKNNEKSKIRKVENQQNIVIKAEPKKKILFNTINNKENRSNTSKATIKEDIILKNPITKVLDSSNNRQQIKDLELKLQKMQTEMSAIKDDMEKKNEALKNKDKMIEQLHLLNIKLQEEMFPKIDQIAEKIDAHNSDASQNKNFGRTIENNFPIGHVDLVTKCTYLGFNEWIENKTLQRIMSAKEPSIFVKNCARYVFGPDVLRLCTVTGKTSNRSRKNQNNDGKEKPKPLDPEKLFTIRELYKEYLKKNNNRDTVAKELLYDTHLGKLTFHIGQLINDLKKQCHDRDKSGTETRNIKKNNRNGNKKSKKTEKETGQRKNIHDSDKTDETDDEENERDVNETNDEINNERSNNEVNNELENNKSDDEERDDRENNENDDEVNRNITNASNDNEDNHQIQRSHDDEVNNTVEKDRSDNEEYDSLDCTENDDKVDEEEKNDI